MRKKLFLILIPIMMMLALLTSCGDDGWNNPGNSQCYSIKIMDGNSLYTNIEIYQGDRISIAPPSKAGNTYLGIYTSDGTCVVDINGNQTNILIDRDMELYIRWQALDCTLTFDPGEGLLGDNEKSQVYTYGSALAGFPVPEREGYTFNGWLNGDVRVTDENGFVYEEYRYLDSSYVFKSETDVLLTADYSEKQYSLYFDYNDPGFENTSVNMPYGSTVAEIKFPEYDDGKKIIIGWSITPGYMLSPDSDKITEDMTFYAIWKEYRPVKIYVRGNEYIDAKVFSDEDYSTVPDLPGYEFEGWYTNNFYSGSPIYAVSYHSDIDVLWSKWSIINYHVDLYDESGAAYGQYDYTVEDNIPLPVFEDKGEFEFLGWCSKPDLSDEPIKALSGTTGVTALYPRWRDYTVFNCYNDDGTVYKVQVKIGSTFTLLLPRGIGAEKQFYYWYTRIDGKDVPMTDKDCKGLEAWTGTVYSIDLYPMSKGHASLSVYYTLPGSTEKVLYSSGSYMEGDEAVLTFNDKSYVPAGFYKNDILLSSEKSYTYVLPAGESEIVIKLRLKDREDLSAKMGFNVYHYNGHYYAVISDRAVNWAAAKEYCEFLGGHLATVTSEEENTHLIEIMRSEVSDKAARFWLGATDEASEGNWQWVTGEKFSYSNWYSGEPNGGRNENYVEFCAANDDKWNDLSGSNSRGFVCEWDSYSSIIIPDERELTFNDGTKGTVKIYSFGGHCYAIFDNVLSWPNAEKFCEYIGGHLATITSAEENAYLVRLNSYMGKSSNLWLGGSDYGKEGEWLFVTGEKFGYSNWNSGEPNNSGGNEDYLLLLSSGRWNDGGTSAPFVCEWESRSAVGQINYGNYYKQIYSAQDLLSLNSASEKWGGTGDAILMRNIDMSGVEWTPVDLAGTFDGNGYTIKNLTVSGSQSLTGMFGTVSGTLKNINFENLTIVSNTEKVKSRCGLIAYMNGGTVDGVKILSGSISSTWAETGAIVGEATASSKILNCVNYASVTSQNTASSQADVGTTGGIVGWLPNGAVVENCKNYGRIVGTYQVSGIIGASGAAITIANCENMGDVKGLAYIGGIIGEGAAVTVNGCRNTGVINGTSYVGKYVGTTNVTYQDLPVVEISSADKMYLLMYAPSVESFVLTSDIDMSGVEWTPVDFAGTLNGQGFAIKNLTLSSSEAVNLSMFGTVSGTISDLVLKNVSIKSTSYKKVNLAAVCITLSGKLQNISVYGNIVGGLCNAGGIAAVSSGGTFENCSNYATITTASDSEDGLTAGIVASFPSGILTDCVNYGNISGHYRTAGIAALVNGGSVTSCKNCGNISGHCRTAGVIADCEGTNNINLLKNYGTVTSTDDYTGGVCAVVVCPVNMSLVSGYENHGEVSSTADYCGGVFGYFRSNTHTGYSSGYYSFTLANFTNDAKVTGKTYVGGLIGYTKVYAEHNGSYTSVNKLTATSGMSNTGDITGQSYVGGLYGYAYSNDSSSVVTGTSSADITGEYIVGGIAGQLEYIRLKDSDNSGSTVTATSYRLESDNTMNVWLGGYVGLGYAAENCHNAIDVIYKSSGNYIGGIAGVLRNGNAINCSNSGYISAEDGSNVGGLFGWVYSSGNIEYKELSNTGVVIGTGNVGGIAGQINNSIYIGYSSAAYVVKFTKFKNAGAVTGKSFVGGIAGYAHVTATHSGSYTSLTALNVNSCTNIADVTGNDYVGGLFGYAYSNDTSSVISSCNSSGTVTASYIAGGLAGQLQNIRLSDCSNKGTKLVVDGYKIDGSNYYAYIGGYAGNGYSAENCHNAVTITYNERGMYVGGIFGYTNGVLTNCSNTADITSTNNSYVGGIAGYITYGGNVVYSSLENSGNISGGTMYTGGIAGALNHYIHTGYSSASYTVSLRNMKNTGNVTGGKGSGNTSSKVGGLFGQVYVTAAHSGSYTSVCKIIGQELTNEGNVTGHDYVGGLFGYAYSNGSGSELVSSTSSGKVAGTGGANVADIIGKSDNITIK